MTANGLNRRVPGSRDWTSYQHWFTNAESYFLIGDALGEGMKRLLENSGTP